MVGLDLISIGFCVFWISWYRQLRHSQLLGNLGEINFDVICLALVEGWIFYTLMFVEFMCGVFGFVACFFVGFVFFVENGLEWLKCWRHPFLGRGLEWSCIRCFAATVPYVGPYWLLVSCLIFLFGG